MVKLLIGKKGSGKTKAMIDMANNDIQAGDGSVVFICRDQRVMYDLKYRIRVVSMDEYPCIENSDEYIGFIAGIISSDHDLETIYIDSILKHADINEENIPEFLSRLKHISEVFGLNFVVSLSTNKEDVKIDFSDFELLN